MKKIISLALVLLMLFSILFTSVSCGKDNDTDPPASDGSGNEGGDEGNKDDARKLARVDKFSVCGVW